MAEAEAGASKRASSERGRPIGLIPASAVLVAAAFASGLRLGWPWMHWLLVVAAVGQGFLGGLHVRRFWRGTAREEMFGAGLRYLAFLAAVAFTAVEAHAVGAGIEAGAPRASVALLLPPVVVGGWALRSAVRKRDERDERGADRAERP